MRNDTRTIVIIMGATGRDFPNFNIVFRDGLLTRIVAFAASPIPDIADRSYPQALSESLYPYGIPIAEESELIPLIKREPVCE